METNLHEAAERWDALAANAIERGALGITDPMVAGYQADTYQRTAESLRIQIRTGSAVCTCCFKPFGSHR